MDINISEIKTTLINYLYDKVDIYNNKYTILKNVSDVYELKQKKYYISGNTCGINSFIIFYQKDDKFYSYLVDRRTLNHNRNYLKMDTIRLIPINCTVDKKMYEGTIIDGILIDNGTIQSNTTQSNTKMMFMITDVFVMQNKNIMNVNYKQKMYMIKNLFKEYDNYDKRNNIELYISRPYELNEISQLFNEVIKLNQKKYNIKGLTIYPEYSGNKLIYIFDKDDEKYKQEILNGKTNIYYDYPNNNLLNDKIINTETKIIKQTNTNINTNDSKNTDVNNIINNINNIINEHHNSDEIIEDNEQKKYICELIDSEIIEDIILNFEMIKTPIQDVYKLYALLNNKNKLIKIFIDVAYINSYNLSLKCKNIFKNKNNSYISCIFNSYKNKWTPIEELTINNKLSIINNDKRLIQKIVNEE